VLWRRLSFLLIAAWCFAACWSVHRGVDSPARLKTTTAVGESVTGTSSLAPSVPRPNSLSPFAPWRYRLKSVLPESHLGLDQEADLGPVPSPDASYHADVLTPTSLATRALVPLRC
jgi:hypothetical protein